MMITLQSLLQPLPQDQTYDDLAALNRTRQLDTFYNECYRDHDLAARAIELSRRSFWNFLALFCWTYDQKAHVHPQIGAALRVKPFPPMWYFRHLSNWLDEKKSNGEYAHPRVFIDKSRDMQMSWYAMARLHWGAMFNAYEENPVMSKNEKDAKEMIKRVVEMANFLPDFLLQILDVQIKIGTEVVKYSNGSEVYELPQGGGHGARSRVPTRCLADEAAFQDRFRDNWGTLAGKADDRTQMIAVSTAQSSHFGELILDREDARDGGREMIYEGDYNSPDPSVCNEACYSLWRNERNGLYCARLYFFVDPGKNSAEWVRSKSVGMTDDQIMSELWIDYDVRAGRRIFPMLRKDVHTMPVEPRVVPLGAQRKEWGLIVPGYSNPDGTPRIRPVRLLRLMDYGLSGWFGVLWIAIDDQLDWTIYREYKVTGQDPEYHRKTIAELSGDELYTLDVLDAMQPTPFAGGGQIIDKFQEWETPAGRRPYWRIERPIKGAHSRQEGLDAIAQMLLSTIAACAGHQHPYLAERGYTEDDARNLLRYSSIYIGANCPEIFKELKDARYDEPTDPDPKADRPETSNNMADDLIDCLRYGIRGAAHLLRHYKPPVN